MCVATVGAGKMRMTLVFGTPVTEFEVPGSVLQESFVDKADGNKTFEGAINRDFVCRGRGKLCSNLLGCLRFASLQQDT